MSFLGMGGVMYSGEDYDAESTVGADAIAPDESDTLAAAVSEINEDESAMANGMNEIEGAEMASDGLETIADKIEEANEGDGMTPEAMEVVETSVETIMRLSKLHIPYKKLGIPSAESFRNRSNRYSMGEISVESLRDTARNIWRKIIEAIKKAIVWVKQLWNKLFGGAERMLRRAKSLKERAGNLTGKPEETTFESETLFKRIHIGNSLPDLNMLKKASQSVYDALKTQDDIINIVYDKFGELEEYAEKNKGSATKTVTLVNELDRILLKFNSKKNSSVPGSSIAVYSSSEFPGGLVVESKLPIHVSGADSYDNNIISQTIGCQRSHTTTKVKEVTDIKVLSLNDIISFAEIVEKTMIFIIDYKKEASKIESKKEDFIKKIEKYFAKGDGREDNSKHEKKRESERSGRAIATIFRKFMDDPAKAMSVTCVQSFKGILEYAELSAREYSSR